MKIFVLAGVQIVPGMMENVKSGMMGFHMQHAGNV